MSEALFVNYALGLGQLPVSELEGAMEAERAPFLPDEGIQGVVRFRSDPAKAQRAVSRLAMSRFMCKELCFSRGDPADLLVQIRKGITLPSISSFRVTVKRMEHSVPPEAVMKLEREVGAELAMATGARVDLSKPENTFILLVSSRGYVFGLRTANAARKVLPSRRNELKPFTHHSALQPEFCRVLVNLARVRARNLVLDPFCGSGGILMEACDLGASGLGLDIKGEMTRGARLNLSEFGFQRFHLAVGDVRCCPFRRADAIVTDPPYGRLSPTVRDRSAGETYQDLVDVSARVLPTGGYLALVCPSNESVDEMLREGGFTAVCQDEVRVHDTLTRVFMAAKR